MVKKKRSIHETKTTIIVDDETAITSTEEDQVFTSLCTSLAEINKREDVIGYILRSATSAAIDLKDPTKLIEYAILSSQTLDSSGEISELFALGDINYILIEGKNIKALCIAKGENTVSIFMEKDAEHTDILRQVSP